MECAHNKYLRRHGYKYVHVTVRTVITPGYGSEQIHLSNTIFVTDTVHIVAKFTDTFL